MLRHISELESLFPNVQKTRSSEWHSPCPFCRSGTQVLYRNTTFYGSDRLIWFLNENVLVCRRCREEGRGRGGKGLYTLSDAAHFFGQAADLSTAGEYEFKREEVPLRGLWSDEMVRAAHRDVQRPYFYQFGWDDETIDRFQLGRAPFRGSSTPLHIIPMRIERVIKHSPDDVLGPIEGWYIATRGGDRPYRTSGSVFNYWWHIVNNPDSAVVLLAEGEKDGISLAQMFPQFNVVVAWGAASWTPSKTQLLTQRYREVWVFGDADEAGRALNEQVSAQCRSFGLRCRWAVWPEDTPNGADVTDWLAERGAGAAEALTALLSSEEPPVQRVSDVASGRLTIEDVRSADHPMSIRRALNDYMDNPQGQLLLLAAPPGAGKTHALVELAERVALEVQSVRFAERLRLMEEIDELSAQGALSDEERDHLERLRGRLERFSTAEVAWFGQYKAGFDDLLRCGVDESLWFNYEARSAQNCRNYATAAQLGQQNHDVGKFCALGCQFRDLCEQDGYLAQEKKRRERPITFFRHEHITSAAAASYRRLVIIDENPCDVYDSNPLLVSASDLLPHDPNWMSYAHDAEQAAWVDLFASVVRSAVAQTPPQGALSGADFIDLTASALKAVRPDVDLANLLDVVDPRVIDEVYHPNYLPNGGDAIKKRCLKDVYTALVREMPAWLEGRRRAPSCIHLTPYGLELYRPPQLQLLRRVPIVAADATAFPDLYEILFRRPVAVYRPQLYNPNAVITVVKGSDYTKTSVREQLGEAIDALRRETPQSTQTLLGEELPLAELVESSVERYHSRILNDVVSAVHRLSSQHESLLVVTYKSLKELTQLMPWPSNVSFGHYGALRGSNAYEHVEAVLLIGAFRVPYDVVWRKVSAWLALRGDAEAPPPETCVVTTTFPNTNEETTYRTFAHPFADQYVHMIEAGELIQSAERIRPHSTTKPKYVYVLANRPALPYTTRVVKRSVFFNVVDEQSAYNQALNFALAHIEHHHVEYNMFVTPTYREITQRFKLSNRDVRRVLEEARRRYEERLKREAERLPTSSC